MKRQEVLTPAQWQECGATLKWGLKAAARAPSPEGTPCGPAECPPRESVDFSELG